MASGTSGVTTAGARERGYWTFPSTPYGYRRVGTPPRELLEPDEHAPVVRALFAALASGASAAEVARMLNARRVRAPGPERETWTRHSVEAIAGSSVYAGYIPLPNRKYAASRSEPLVPERLWDLVREPASREAVRKRRGTEKARAQREAFEAGYWHHQKVPRGCVRAEGEWPRYILAPGPEFPRIRGLLETIASGADRAIVEVEAREVFAQAIRRWKNPSEAITTAIRRYALNPVFAGYTTWKDGGVHVKECRPARWAPFVEPEVWLAAYWAVHGREPHYLNRACI